MSEPLETEEILYQFGNDGSSLNINAGVRIFNRGIKRGNTTLVTGDRPRFALVRMQPEDALDPALLKLGDGRFRLQWEGQATWLDELETLSTDFAPSQTTYHIQWPLCPDLQITLEVGLAQDWGLVASLSLINRAATRLSVQVDCVYGGLARHGRTFTAAYFPADAPDTEHNTCLLAHDHALLGHEKFSASALAISVPRVEPRWIDARAVFSWSLTMAPREETYIALIIEGSEIPVQDQERIAHANPRALLEEGRQYYTRLLEQFSITTPSMLLTNGFRIAVLNLEYDYSAPAWLEGVHWWSAPWVNNYQIGAAIALGQHERAKEALAFFAEGERGPCPIRLASGQPISLDEIYGDEDGLPYWLLQVLDYYHATGDAAFVRELWPKIHAALQRLLQVRVHSGHGLLDWHYGCNAFLYQADHLGMPGEAASPSLIIAGLLEQLVALGGVLDLPCGDWAERAAHLYEQMLNRLWNAEVGVFYNHRDEQEVCHLAHYYTDLIFPTLYTSLPPLYGWQCLAYLNRTLSITTRDGRQLLRVGDFKPPLFGNDNVMPTQMAEAARAFFAIGAHEEGTRLLEAVAFAGTVFTDAPGNFPERMSDEGRGESNFLFGNPIGSFLQGIIRGLFGLIFIEGGTALRWQPGFPGTWEHAALTLPDVSVIYRQEHHKPIYQHTYIATHTQPRALQFRLFLDPCEIVEVLVNGVPTNYTLTPALAHQQFDLRSPCATRHQVTLKVRPLTLSCEGPTIGVPHEMLSWQLSGSIAGVHDPQGVFEEIHCNGSTLTGRLSACVGVHQVFVETVNPGRLMPLNITIQPEYELVCGSAHYDAHTEMLRVPLTVIMPQGVRPHPQVRLAHEWHSATHVLEDSDLSTHACEITLPCHLAQVIAGVISLESSVSAGTTILLHRRLRVVVRPYDEETARRWHELQEYLLETVDLAPWRNSSSIFATSRWRRDMLTIEPAHFTQQGVLSTPAGSFQLSVQHPCLALVEYGRTDAATRLTQRSSFPATLTIPVERQVSGLLLLYVSEMESRHTGATVGSLTMIYEHGERETIPLVAGQQLDTLYSHWAQETIEVVIGPADEFNQADSLNVWQVPCQATTRLLTLQLAITVPDVQCGLLALTLVRAPADVILPSLQSASTQE